MKRLTIIACLFILCGCKSNGQKNIFVAPQTEETNASYQGYAISTLSVVNHHEEPDVDKELGCQSLMGTVLRVIEEQNNWYKVETPEKYLAWVAKEAISFKDSLEIEAWNSADKWIFTDYFGIVYSSADSKANPICDITQGCLLIKGNKHNGDFYECVLPNGAKGYVLKKSVEDFSDYISNVKLSGESIVALAKRFLGFPYVWGGNSPKGMDCSGLTQFIYHLHGINLPRNASSQGTIGKEVSIENGYELLLAGDLIFFCNTTPGKINHVGIYIGDGEFIHSGTTAVKINSLNKNAENYYSKANNLFCARRILE